MKVEHKRLIELGNSWQGSDAVVTISPADATLLETVGAKVTRPAKGRPNDPCSIKGNDLYEAAQRLAAEEPEIPEGGEPTPNQLSVTGGGSPGPVGDAADADADHDEKATPKHRKK